MCHVQNVAIAHIVLARLPGSEGFSPSAGDRVAPKSSVHSALCSYLSHLLHADPRLGAMLLRQGAVPRAHAGAFLQALPATQQAEALQMCRVRLTELCRHSALAADNAGSQVAAQGLRGGGSGLSLPSPDVAGRDGLFWLQLGRAALRVRDSDEQAQGAGDDSVASSAATLRALVRSAAAELLRWPALSHEAPQLCDILCGCGSRDAESWSHALEALRHERERLSSWATLRAPGGGAIGLKRGCDAMAQGAQSALQLVRAREERMFRCRVCE